MPLTRFTRWNGTVVVGACIAVSMLSPRAAVAAEGDVIVRWVNQTFDAVRSGGVAGPPDSRVHTGTPGAARTYAIVGVAMWNAVNGIDRAAGTSTRAQWRVPPAGAPPANANREHAAAAAAYHVLVWLFPERAATLNTALAAEGCPLPIGGESEAGCRWGHDAGLAVRAERQDDSVLPNRSKTYCSAAPLPPCTAGVFPRTFSGTQFKDMPPFGVVSIAPYLSPGPVALTSERWAEDFNEVKEIGSALDTDTEREAIARHWQAEGGTIRETGLWLKAALTIIDSEHTGTIASLSETARLFALLGIGIADAIKTSWTAKFTSGFWRPGDAIRQAEIDGNDATPADPGWNPRLGRTAPCRTGAPLSTCAAFGGTPEYTSGTSTFAGAASTVLAFFYCRDDIPFEFARDPSGSVRSFTGFKDAAREAGRSRVYGGIHYQFSIEAGYEAGKDLGREVVRTQLVREDEPAGRSACVP